MGVKLHVWRRRVYTIHKPSGVMKSKPLGRAEAVPSVRGVEGGLTLPDGSLNKSGPRAVPRTRAPSDNSTSSRIAVGHIGLDRVNGRAFELLGRFVRD